MHIFRGLGPDLGGVRVSPEALAVSRVGRPSSRTGVTQPHVAIAAGMADHLEGTLGQGLGQPPLCLEEEGESGSWALQTAVPDQRQGRGKRSREVVKLKCRSQKRTKKRSSAR